MKLITYNPVKEINRIERELEEMGKSDWNALPILEDLPAMDMYEEDGNLVTEVNLPNFERSEVSVAADDGILEISAEHNSQSSSRNKRLYYFRESRDRYFRRVTLPDGVLIEKAKAMFRDGVLKVSMPLTAA